MRKNTLRIAAVTVAAVPILLATGTGTANAYSPPAVEGGRARIQVTAAPGPELGFCRASLDGGLSSAPFGGDGQSASTMFRNVSTGTTHTVDVTCLDAVGNLTNFPPTRST